MLRAVRDDLPSGTVTFLFTDVEGSTQLLHELGAEEYAEALAEHRRVIREACARHGGVEVDTQGDAFFFAFPSAPGALPRGARDDRGVSPQAGFRCGSACTRERRCSPRTATSETTFTSGPGSPASATAARSSSRHSDRGDARRGDSLIDLGEHRLKDIAEAVSDPPAGGRLVPAAEDDLEYEPAAAGELLRGPGAGARATCWPRSTTARGSSP